MIYAIRANLATSRRTLVEFSGVRAMAEAEEDHDNFVYASVAASQARE